MYQPSEVKLDFEAVYDINEYEPLLLHHKQVLVCIVYVQRLPKHSKLKGYKFSIKENIWIHVPLI